MDKNFPIILEKKEDVFYCSIPELKLVSKSENLNDAYEKIEILKDERLKASNEYEQFCGTRSFYKKSTEDYLKLTFITLFFILLTIGISSHLLSTFFGNFSNRVENLTSTVVDKVDEKINVAKVLNSFQSLPPEQKEAKIKRFQKKMENAQKLLIEAKPFIEASKPFLRDLQRSFDLKNPRP